MGARTQTAEASPPQRTIGTVGPGVLPPAQNASPVPPSVPVGAPIPAGTSGAGAPRRYGPPPVKSSGSKLWVWIAIVVGVIWFLNVVSTVRRTTPRYTPTPYPRQYYPPKPTPPAPISPWGSRSPSTLPPPGVMADEVSGLATRLLQDIQPRVETPRIETPLIPTKTAPPLPPTAAPTRTTGQPPVHYEYRWNGSTWDVVRRYDYGSSSSKGTSNRR